MKRFIKKQAGFLSIILLVMIVIIGFLGVIIVNIFTTQTGTIIDHLYATKAFYLAESGLEHGARSLLTPLLTGANPRIACNSVSGHSRLTDVAFAEGVFTVNTLSGSPFYSTATLTSPIIATSATIPVTSTAGYAPAGRIMIDGEMIDYSRVTASQFIVAQRGADGSMPAFHGSGVRVGQYQCSLNAVAGIPNLTAPTATRQLQYGILLQEGWVVGARSGNYLLFSHWNRPELQWQTQLLAVGANREDLNAVAMLSYVDGWAVGNQRSGNFTVARWNGSTWQYAGVRPNGTARDLFGIAAVSANDVWAVGAGGTIQHWNGTAWLTAISPVTTTLTGIALTDANGDGVAEIAWAVGVNGVILRYADASWSIWTQSPIATTQSLNSISSIGSSEAWAVGNNGTIIHWNGVRWNAVPSPTTVKLNAMTMLDTNADGIADTGWAVGNNGVAIRYNGRSWIAQNPGGATLRGVAMATMNDVWAVGNGGRIAHWDGAAWTNIASGVTQHLNGISLIAPKRDATVAWREIFG